MPVLVARVVRDVVEHASRLVGRSCVAVVHHGLHDAGVGCAHIGPSHTHARALRVELVLPPQPRTLGAEPLLVVRGDDGQRRVEAEGVPATVARVAQQHVALVAHLVAQLARLLLLLALALARRRSLRRPALLGLPRRLGRLPRLPCLPCPLGF
eukprot:1115131-Prymnesium_polylepis.1